MATSQLKQIEAKIELATQRSQRNSPRAHRGVSAVLQKEAQEELQVFALEMKQTLFSGKKSLHLRHGSIGFRTGTPRVIKKRIAHLGGCPTPIQKQKMAFRTGPGGGG